MESGLPCLILNKFRTTARRGIDQIRLSLLNQRRIRVRATRICRHLIYTGDKCIYFFLEEKSISTRIFLTLFLFWLRLR